jgi:hypothetical protein
LLRDIVERLTSGPEVSRGSVASHQIQGIGWGQSEDDLPRVCCGKREN